MTSNGLPPLVSIIVSNYNYGRFIAETINSALQQTYHPIEVILVDDGSTDESREVIQSFGDRITAIFKGNGGQASALNAGFARSRGKVVIFLDSDDILSPDLIQKVVESFQANPNLSKLQYRMELIDEQGRRLGKLKPAEHLPVPCGSLQRQMLSFPFDLVWLPTSGIAFSAEILNQIFPIPEEEFRILADYYLSNLTPLFGPVGFLDRIGAYYRIHGKNNYEPSTPSLNLDHVRQTLVFWRRTQGYIKIYADQLKLKGRPERAEEILSVAYIANRAVSLKIDPDQHPIPGDSLAGLFLLGVKAALRRFDVSWPMKLMFIAWFAAVEIAPKDRARKLAEIFFFPEKREKINKYITGLHRNGSLHGRWKIRK